MIDIETFYLIDYENVHGDGLSGCQDLGKTDHILIFFTPNAKRIDMSDISNHGSADLKMIKVPAGKQSADIHIGSYLGYLAGKCGKDCSVVIVSGDTDFDNIIKFWSQRTEITVSRAGQIKKKTASKPQSGKAQPAITDKTAKKAGPSDKTKVNNQPQNRRTTVSAKNKAATNIEIQGILSKARFSHDIICFVASTVVKNLGQENAKQQIYRTIIAKYGQNKGLTIYNHIKKHI